MELRLVISDRRRPLLDLWAAVFHDIPSVVFREIEIRALMGLSDIDAVLMMGIFAHERYGGRPILGQSQILKGDSRPGSPTWIVTTPSFPAHLEGRSRPTGKDEFVIVPDKTLSSEEELYVVFKEVFKRILEFNRGPGNPRIATLGFDLEFLNIHDGETWREAGAVHRAYVECGVEE